MADRAALASEPSAGVVHASDLLAVLGPVDRAAGGHCRAALGATDKSSQQIFSLEALLRQRGFLFSQQLNLFPQLIADNRGMMTVNENHPGAFALTLIFSPILIPVVPNFAHEHRIVQ
ncbi:hypothetical protein D3C75_997860 [compost metagenome]